MKKPLWLLFRHFFLLFLCSYLFLSLPQSSRAVSFQLETDKTSITSFSEEITVHAQLSVSTTNGMNYYLRGVFAKEGTTKYCGETWNGNSWYSGPFSSDGWKNLLPITVNDDVWSGNVQIRFPNNDSNCLTSGTYIVKLQRYTNSGTGNFDDQNTLSLQVSLPSPTLTPTQTPTPTPTTKPTSTPTPTKTPTPPKTPTPVKTLTPTKVPTTKPSSTPHAPTVTAPKPISPTSTITVTASVSARPSTNRPTSVLGVSTKKEELPSPTAIVLIKDLSENNFLPIAWSLGGISTLCAILLYYRKRI